MRRLTFLRPLSAGFQFFCDARVHIAGLIDNHHTRWTTGFHPEHQRRHDRKTSHQQRSENGRHYEKFRPHALDVFAFDNGEEFSHADSLTFSMKMSWRVGSTNSNFVTAVPESTKRFSRV